MISPFFFFWNIKGVGTSQQLLKKIIKNYRPNILTLPEFFLWRIKFQIFWIGSVVSTLSLMKCKVENFGCCGSRLC